MEEIKANTLWKPPDNTEQIQLLEHKISSVPARTKGSGPTLGKWTAIFKTANEWGTRGIAETSKNAIGLSYFNCLFSWLAVHLGAINI